MGAEDWLRNGIWFLSGAVATVSFGLLIRGIQEGGGRRRARRRAGRKPIHPFVRGLWVSMLLVTVVVGAVAFSVDNGRRRDRAQPVQAATIGTWHQRPGASNGVHAPYRFEGSLPRVVPGALCDAARQGRDCRRNARTMMQRLRVSR
jgi:hypothetical protein